MSESQVNKSSTGGISPVPNTTPNPAIAQSQPVAPSPTPAASTSPATTSAAQTPSSQAQPVNPVQFSSTMATKASQPRGYFDKQNAERAEKKAKQKKSTKIALAVIIPLFVVAVIAAGVCLFLFWPKTGDKPEEVVQFSSETIQEDITKLRELASRLFNRKLTSSDGATLIEGDFAAAEEVFEATLEEPGNANYRDQILLSKMLFAADNGAYDLALNTSTQIAVNNLSPDLKVQYYSCLYLIYSALNDRDAAQDAMMQQVNSIIELNGGGQGD